MLFFTSNQTTKITNKHTAFYYIMWCVVCIYACCVCVWCAKNARSAFLNMLFNCASINSLFHIEKCVIYYINHHHHHITTYCAYFIIYSLLCVWGCVCALLSHQNMKIVLRLMLYLVDLY